MRDRSLPDPSDSVGALPAAKDIALPQPCRPIQQGQATTQITHEDKTATKNTDKRVSLLHHRVEQRQRLDIDGKYDPATRTLKVYRIHGDVTQPELLHEALEVLTNELGLNLHQP